MEINNNAKTTMVPQQLQQQQLQQQRQTNPIVLFLVVVILCASHLCKECNGTVVEPNNEDLSRLLSWDEIEEYFERKDLDGLYLALRNNFIKSPRNFGESSTPAAAAETLDERLIKAGGAFHFTAAHKLKHDLEQAEYLAQHHKTQDFRNLFENFIVPVYGTALARAPPLHEMEESLGYFAFDEHDFRSGIGKIYNKAIHHTDFPPLKDSAGNPQPIINPNLDIDAIQRDWNTDDPTKQNAKIIVIDDLLTQSALNRIRQLLLESTVWFHAKAPLTQGKYVGAYLDDGLYDRILLQLSLELHQALPEIMQDHPLQFLWAYKYDSDNGSSSSSGGNGINIHADAAAVNVNLWITPDEANLDSTSGGLVVYTVKPPEDWDFQYDENVIKELLSPSNYANVTIPHRQNRAVIFESSLFHCTDRFRFKEGYENRRINLTLLYGRFQAQRRQNDNEELSSSKKSDAVNDEF